MLEVIDVSKDFKGVHALKNVDACFYAGEIHGLVGENGAGKSTMMKIVCGLYPPSSGYLKLDGEEISFKNPHDAYNAGVRIVHQELSLIRSLSIAENIYIHKYKQGKFFKTVDRAKLVKDAEVMLAEWGIDVDAAEPVSNVSMGIRQLVEIARELSTGGELIILDEPTTSLTVSEIEKLFEIMNKLREQGLTIIFISHRLDEVTEIVDRLTVLRDGEVIGTALTKEMTAADICTMIAGEDLASLYPKTPSEIGEVAFEAKNFTGAGFNNIDIHVKWGEIVGLVGLVGAGRSELCRSIFGLDHRDEGELIIEGKSIKIKNASESVDRRIALLSENREEEGIFPILSVANNIVVLKIKNVIGKIFLRKDKAAKIADQMKEKLSIASYNPMTQTIQELSGGNQQKVLFGRLLALDPKILILDEPTRGVDISNKTEIHKIIGDFVKAGGATLMVSSELEEVLGISDRIYVLHEGDMMDEIKREDFNKETILKLMMGLEKGA